MLGKKLITAAAGSAAGGGGLGVEDVFSTWLYTGNGSTQTITNGIDLAGEGGLVWTKNRVAANDHALYDTVRGATKGLYTNRAVGEGTDPQALTGFNSDGWDVGADGTVNTSSQTYASWTFRKAPKFFDVVTYTGNGTTQEINHNLGSTPGCIIIKRTNGSASWCVWHRGNGSTFYTLLLNTTDSSLSSTYNSTNAMFVSAPTSTSFTVKNLGFDSQAANGSGDTYVAYLFAHDAGGFGDDGTESVIKCGSYSGTGSYQEINLGWEAQWVLIKKATNNNSTLRNWHLFDNVRGATVDGVTEFLKPNLSDAFSAFTLGAGPAAVGFNVNGGDNFNTSGETYIYIAIRRGPMKTPTDATEVFDVDAQAGGGFVTTSFPVDLSLLKRRTIEESTWALSRLQGGTKYLETASTSLEQTGPIIRFDSNVGVEEDAFSSTSSLVYFNFRRAPSFFDVVAYTGTSGSASKAHNLQAIPELIIVKVRNANGTWYVYTSSTGSAYLALNTTAAATSTFWGSHTSTSFGVAAGINDPNETYIAYLFASCPGVSKVGSYTGTGTTLDIDCGFTAGARFVLIKRTDSTNGWYVWDTARGIVSGDDPYLRLNLTAAEVTDTDYIDPLSSGFQISSTAPTAINANGGSYIFLAIA